MSRPNEAGEGASPSVRVYVVDHTSSELLLPDPYCVLKVGEAASADESAEAAGADASAVGEAVCAGEATDAAAEAATAGEGAVAYDCTGDSISCKNFAYCELTGLYWVWKNSREDIVGLEHYRRMLREPNACEPLSRTTTLASLAEADFLVAEPLQLGCSVAEHFCYNHSADDLRALYQIMDTQPEIYQSAFREVMNGTSFMPFNIMVAGKELVDLYCEWLFGILGQLERKIDLYHGRDAYQMRIFGFLAERLFNVWLKATGCTYKAFGLVDPATGETFPQPKEPAHPYRAESMLGGFDGAELFDPDFYLACYPDVAAHYSLEDARRHYLDFGLFEGRFATPEYAMLDYLNARPALRAKVGKNPERYFAELARECEKGPVTLPRHIVHGVTRHGLADYAPVYDWLYYTTRYDDVPGDYFDTEAALEHFAKVGMKEGRQASRGFNLAAYKKKNPQLAAKFGNDNERYYKHYIKARKGETGIDWSCL